ncbi:MAG: beta-ketoacyl-[acyl-carrier-protein] synthase family protein, partial [Desulfobulbaceae bacterium]|nr:beta-ketoacyl-[acyl-carrier-protein] synthase family protein [Desulfobulbaceae bacterium]
TSACTSSAQAIGLGYLLVGTGRQQAMLCGGADEVHHSVTSFFDVLQAASRKNDTPGKTPAPFDTDRDGVVCGGGSGILVLESLESALARKARIYAEIIGFGNTSDPGHIANPQAKAMTEAIKKALKEAQINGAEVDYVNAHATGTIRGDLAEAKAIGEAISPTTPVSSLKGHMGHTLGAAGVLESMVSLKMMQQGELLPTKNLQNIDPECNICSVIKTEQKKQCDIILKNSFALGGVNTAILYKRYM